LSTTTDDTPDPVLAIATTDAIGRLYRRPDFVLPEKLPLKKIKELVISGDLVPSTTNIISVRSSPYLVPWAARLSAKAAVDLAKANPNMFFERVKANPFGAIDYFKKASDRERDFAGNQGSKIHLGCELLGAGLNISHLTLTDYESKSLDQFKFWLDKFQPEMQHLEITGYGTTKEDNLGYAHTTDVICNINGKTIIGDYKCVVDDTPVLLPDGSTKKAIDVVEGDEVVAWDKSGLHTAKVSYAGDNGFHKVATITTASGHRVTSTLNHPFWSSRKSQQLGWVTAEDLKIGDEVYVAMGWNYSQYRQAIEWPYKKNLSPYLLGLFWTLRNFSRQDWRTENLIELPKISKDGLKQELQEIGFQFNKAGKLNTTKGFAKIARKNGITVDDFLDLVDTSDLPDFVYGATPNQLYAFFAGVREVFANKEIYAEELFVVLNRPALESLQQLFANYGQPANITTDPKTGYSYLKTPFEKEGTIFTHGPSVTRVTSIEITEEEHHTVAIEVAGSHTHITGGLITHNTNRKGLHMDVSYQLAANARGDKIAIDNKELVDMPQIDAAVGIHISPKGVTTQRIDISDEVYNTFQSLRRVWDMHAFHGELRNPKGVFLEEIHGPEDI
jgi:hypothetical protein